MHVSEIWIYPIKGIGGQIVDSALATESGFKYDRRLMLVDKNNKFISQRSHPKLARLAAETKENKIRVFEKSNTENNIDFNYDSIQKDIKIISSVWKSKVESFIFDKQINQWFSDFLNDDVKLVKQTSFANRTRSLTFKPNKIGLSYADGYPYLVLSKESVDKLSDSMGEKVDYRQFRANIIVEDCQAFEEDTLKSFKLGNTSFKMVKPCKRCPVIDINQDTGETHQEVLKTLSKERRILNSVIFGMNAAIIEEGTVNIGDKLIF